MLGQNEGQLNKVVGSLEPACLTPTEAVRPPLFRLVKPFWLEQLVDKPATPRTSCGGRSAYPRGAVRWGTAALLPVLPFVFLFVAVIVHSCCLHTPPIRGRQPASHSAAPSSSHSRP